MCPSGVGESKTNPSYRSTVKPEPDMVNHPPHYYGKNGLESIDVIEEFNLGFCLGNAIKYILRHKNKGNPLEDLKKARWYLDREISNWEPRNE